MAEEQVNYKPYSYVVNGKTYYEIVPDFNVSNQYTPASVGQVEAEISRYEGLTDEWSRNYLQSLQSGLSKIQTGTSNYVINQEGQLATREEVASQQAQQQAIAEGTQARIGGTLENPLTVNTGSPAHMLQVDPANYAKFYGGEGVPGFNPTGTYQETINPQQFEDAHKAATDAGATAPTDYTGAKDLYNQFLPDNQQQAPSAVDNFVAQDPYLNTVIQTFQDYMSPQNQRTSLVDTYKTMLKDSGIEQIDTDLINMKNVIQGTEDDIRTEITKAGGFATESQVMALTNARNKQLIKNYNTLLETRNSKAQYLDTMMSLTMADRQEADQRFETMMNFGFKIAEINQQMKQNAISTIDRVAQTLGWDGVYQATQGNPQIIAQIERTYGLPQGSLAIAAQRDADLRAYQTSQQDLDTQYKQAQIKSLGQAEKPTIFGTQEGGYYQQVYDPTTNSYKVERVTSPYNPVDSGVVGDDYQLYAGLDSKTATAVRAKVGQYRSEKSVQNFSTVQEGYNFASSISDFTTNPADDQALIYSLAKALDPDSVVREGEYATAQKYAQSWVKAYGKGVTQAILGTGFLSQEARANIKKTIEQKYNASKASYDNVYNQYVEGINSLTGRDDGSRFITDYSISDVGKVTNNISSENQQSMDSDYQQMVESQPAGSGLTDWLRGAWNLFTTSWTPKL